jgi:hypothetical protein
MIRAILALACASAESGFSAMKFKISLLRLLLISRISGLFYANYLRKHQDLFFSLKMRGTRIFPPYIR